MALAAAVLLLLPGAARAATFTVESTNDDGAGSLRAAITAANAAAGPDLIDATGVSGTIDLQSILPALAEDVTIAGPGADQLTVRGAEGADTSFRIFAVNSGVTARVLGLTIANGFASASSGAGISNSGALILRDSAVTDNQGIGIENAGGSLLIEGSTISGNAATGAVGGGISNAGSLTIRNSTISGNRAANASGVGGILTETGLGSILTPSELTVESTTIAANTNTNSAGAANLRVVLGTVSLRSTIIAQPRGGGENCATALAMLTSGGFNLADDESCGLDQSTDQPGTGPQLRPLADNGGPTETMALPVTSPAIDQGIANGLSTDQRGLTRRVDLPAIPNADGGDGTDVGAFEVQGPRLSLAPTSLSFGEQVVATQSAAQAVQVENAGEVPFNVGGIRRNGQDRDDFILFTDCPSRLGASQTCIVWVVFRPISQGPREAQLVVQSDAPGGPHQVPLSGTGTDADPSPPNGAPQPAPGANLPARLEIDRAWVRNRRLTVRGALHHAAAGQRLAVRFRAAGRRIVLRPRVDPDGQFAVTRRLRGPQRRVRAGRVIVRYAGNRVLRATTERLRAGRRAVRLRFNRARIRGDRLVVAGRVVRHARRQVRITVEFNHPNGEPAEITDRARVQRRGRFQTRLPVPPIVSNRGAQVSVTHPGRARLYGQRLGWDLGV